MPNRQNKALDAEPPIASFVKSMLIGGGPVTSVVLQQIEKRPTQATREVRP
jgi:hypothetical protein